jgi:ribosomal protein L29
MTDQASSLEQTVAHHNAAIAQINEILLLIARRQQETVQIQQENAQQIIANTQDIAELRRSIAELRATLRDRYGGNGQRGE